jgi:hypothetical protein
MIDAEEAHTRLHLASCFQTTAMQYRILAARERDNASREHYHEMASLYEARSREVDPEIGI